MTKWKNKIQPMSSLGWNIVFGMQNILPFSLLFFFCNLFVSGLLFLTQTFLATAFAASWWRLHLKTECTDGSVDLLIDLTIGVCPIDGSRLLGSGECIRWLDKQTWLEIDEMTSSNTWDAARTIFPHIQDFRIAANALCFFQIILCLLHRFFRSYSVESQLTLFFLGILYQAMSLACLSHGRRNDICDPGVWKEVTGCSYGAKNLGDGYWLFMAAEFTMTIAMVVIVLPQYIPVLHMVDFKSIDRSSSSAVDPRLLRWSQDTKPLSPPKIDYSISPSITQEKPLYYGPPPPSPSKVSSNG
jgi:hypothetical protein